VVLQRCCWSCLVLEMYGLEMYGPKMYGHEMPDHEPTNMNVRIASAAYAVPPDGETVEAVLERERDRVRTTLAPLSPQARQKAAEGLGLSRVRVCGSQQPYDLVREAAAAAITDAGITGPDINLILDYSTFPGENSQSLSLAHKLSADLGAETSMNLSFKAGGCGALHLAIKTALGWMRTDETIRTALLVTGDTAPAGNRSLLPVTVQGDAGSAVILRREGPEGPLLLGVEAMTLGHLHDAIALVKTNGHLEIKVDALRIENEVMPIYYLNLYRLVQKVLAASSLSLHDVDHFIYSNISRRDRDGFRRMVGLPEGGLSEGGLALTPMAEYGHTFASDLVINYVHLRREGRIRPGQLLLFASAGIGFTWGVTLARA
jgi:3-oxoacyl-[acyl-carrier-protein] synthase-3